MQDTSTQPSHIQGNPDNGENANRCNNCTRSFRSKRGLNQHLRSCSKVNNSQATQEKEPPDKHLEVNNASTEEVSLLFTWGKLNNNEFTNHVNNIYERIVYWKKNLFLLPTGKAGRKFIEELTRLLYCWVNDTTMKDVAFKAVIIMPSLLLQKPSKASKSKYHLIALERRMEDWFNGDLQKLLHEGDTIQKGLQSSTGERNLNKISKQFADQMHKGNVNSAIKLLTNNMESGILPLNNDTLKLLKQKHPKPAKACKDVLLPDEPESVHFVKFETIDGELVRKACMKTRGGSGPSGMDADG